MGIISLSILAEVEAQLRHLHGDDPNFRLRDFFDFIGGTSTGAIIGVTPVTVKAQGANRI